MDKKKKVIVSTVAAGAVVAGVGTGVYMINDNTANEDADKVKKMKFVEQDKYTRIIKLAEVIGVPTLFDEEEKSPFQTIYVSNGVTDSVFIEYMLFSESGKEMRFVINTNSDQFNVITKDENYKEKELEDGLKVYTDGSSYYWEDKENKAYLSLESLNPENTTSEDLEKAINSIGESRFDVLSKIDYGYPNINIPTYTIGDSEPMELLMDYQDESILNKGEPNHIVNLIYTDVEIGQSKTFDFTKNLSDEEISETIEVNGEEAYIYKNEDNNIVRLFYKYGDTSYVLQVSIMTENDKLLEDTEYAKEELLKVLKSMSFK